MNSNIDDIYNSDDIDNLNSSWSDMKDDLEISIVPKKKQLLESSGSFNMGSSLGKNTKLSMSTSSDFLLNNKNPNQLSIGEILSIDYVGGELEEIDILKNQCYVLSQLKKYVMSCRDKLENFDVQLHLPKLVWLLETSKYLSKKRNLKDIKIKKRHEGLQRNSYEFCNSNYKCSNLRCRQKHFVYNYVNNDISELIKYLEDSTNIHNVKEIYVTINTINFVFNHMHDELFNLKNNCAGAI